ncbi:macro domain-containing protein [Nostocoides australiense]|uniref:Macro domain-containing protein in non 5'region n=1 Tax=Nostocoides australiense Ben110 TaxID=1193182 RepID=W6JVA7_9MICO|nr:macro domain-containing protein [Tetrasphaera australiensis]CCH72495.1 Macro domain-containing protein in non 5'region [Tetrasphaera australiensis Ben110]HPF79651.1 macro domain-containing protein [Tetrasphaera australiensis]HRW01434.1 macro domain-containing protein [Tetrasphaera sp.]
MGRIEIVEGDITKEKVDVIVNAANSSLLGGGGVDGAIHRAAGPGLLEECKDLRSSTLPDGLPPGDAIATRAYNLKKVKWIVHTVGPNRHAGETDPEVLRRCFANSLSLARGLRSHSIAIPAIGAGVYGWDHLEVARIAMAEADMEKHKRGGIEKIRFVLFSHDAKETWIDARMEMPD